MTYFFKLSITLLYVTVYALPGVESVGDRKNVLHLEPIILTEGTLLVDETILRLAIKRSVTPPPTHLTFACPSEDNLLNERIAGIDDKNSEYHRSQYCLFDKQFQTYEDKVCGFPPRPELTPTYLDGAPACIVTRAGDSGYLHNFGFRYCEMAPIKCNFGKRLCFPNSQPKYKSTQIKIYEICYIANTSENVWTKHTILSPLLIEDENISNERLSIENFNLLDKDYYRDIENAFDEHNKKYIDQLIRQKLVPTEDMARQSWQAATSHYVNIAPLWKRHEPLMNVINRSIRKLAARVKQLNGGHIHVYTTTMPLELRRGNRRYVNGDPRYPIPLIWAKLVRYTGPSTHSESILMFLHNTLFNPDEVTAQCVMRLPCNFKEWSMNKLTDEQVEYAYCCEAEISSLASAFPSVRIPNDRILNIDEWLKDSFLEPVMLAKSPVSISTWSTMPSHIVEEESVLEYLLEREAASGSALIYACPPEDEDLKSVIAEATLLASPFQFAEYCAFEKIFKKGEDKKCASPVLPEFVQTTDSDKNPLQCRKGRKGFIYNFGFRYCMDPENAKSSLKSEPTAKNRRVDKFLNNVNTATFEIYKVCYSPSEKSTIWVEYNIMAPLMVEDGKFSILDSHISAKSFGLLDEQYYAKMHDAFEKQNEKSSDYMVRQMLVPLEHLARQPWQTVASHYINIAPLSRKVKPLMDVIDRTLRKLAARVQEKSRSSVVIYASTYTPPLTGINRTYKYLDNENKFARIPDIWCKYVYYLEDTTQMVESVIIFVHNTPISPHLIPKRCNVTIPCNFKTWSMDTLTDEETEYAYCCRPSINYIETPLPSLDVHHSHLLLDINKWVIKDYHPIAIIVPDDIDPSDHFEVTAKYEIADDAVTLQDGSSAYVTQENERIYYLCPGRNEVLEEIEKITSLYTARNCLFAKNFNSTSNENCDAQVKPEIIKVVDQRGSADVSNVPIPCANNETIFLYRVGYWECVNPDYVKTMLKEQPTMTNEEFNTHVRFLYSYDVCYDSRRIRPMWTRHEIKSPTKYPGERYTSVQDQISARNFDPAEFREFPPIHRAYHSQKKGAPDYMVPHLLVPKEDKQSEYWWKATWHYVNSAPLWDQLVPLMKLIEERIRMLADHSVPITIYTGTFDVNAGLPSTERWLKDDTTANREVYISDFWCKLVLHNSSVRGYAGIAIYVSNTPGAPLRLPLCQQQIKCDFKRWSKESTQSPHISEYLLKFAYCCKVDEDATNRFAKRMEINVVGDLDLNNFNGL